VISDYLVRERSFRLPLNCGFLLVKKLVRQLSEDATKAAHHQTRAFFQRVDALPGLPPDADPDYFHMGEPVPKPDGDSCELYIENFERVPEGTVYATVDHSRDRFDCREGSRFASNNH
jgi:hypothetical protein